MDENLGLLTADLETFVAFEGEWDGYVIEIAEPGAGHSVQSLAYWVDVVLRGLSARDRRQDSDLFVAVELKSWWYRFSAVKFFVSTFAPCYDSASSRFTFGVPSCFLLLQPESAFDRAFSRKQGMTPSDVRHFIREKFSAAGRRYDLSITCSAYEAHRYVKPLRSGDSVVRWWECGCDGALDRHDDSLYVEEPTDATEYEI